MKKRIYSPLILLAAAAIWGFAFAAQDAAASVPAFTLGAARSLLATLFLLILIPISDALTGSKRRLISRRGIDFTRGELVGGAICGVILAVATAAQQLGINSGTDGGKAAFITALYVVLVPIYALAIKRRATVNVWISVAIAVVGFYFLCITDRLTVAPSDLYVVLCAVIFPFHILVIDRFSPSCNGLRMCCVQFAVSTLVNIAFAAVFEGAAGLPALSDALPSVLYLGICSSGIAYTLQIIGQRGTDPSLATVILSLESVFGVIGTAVFLGQSLSPREYLGCAIVLVAVILAQLEPKKHAKRE